MNAVRCCLIWIVPTILILITFATIHYAHENRVFSQSGSAITISQLSIKNTPFWKRRW